jgi:hypothetical protein
MPCTPAAQKAASLNVARDVDVKWGGVSKLRFYNDYSVLWKDKSGWIDVSAEVPFAAALGLGAGPAGGVQRAAPRINVLVDVKWGGVSKLRFYNDYSVLWKDKSGWSDSQMNTLGVQVFGKFPPQK